jgi:putative transposase
MEELKQFIQSNPDSRELMRALAVKLYLQGHTYEYISRLLDVSVSFVSKWNIAYEEKGIAGLRLAYKGSVSYLTLEERREILTWIQQQKQWSVQALKQHLEQAYSVVYKSDQSYSELLDAAGMSWKKAQKVNPKADPEEVARKKKKSASTLKHGTRIEKVAH